MARERLDTVLEPQALAYVREKTRYKRKGPGKWLSQLVLEAKEREEAEAARAPLAAAVQNAGAVID